MKSAQALAVPEMKDLALGTLLTAIILFQVYAAVVVLTTLKMYKSAVALVFIAALLGFVMLVTGLTGVE